MTLLESVRKNRISSIVKETAQAEGQGPSSLVERIRKGWVVIPKNKFHRISRPCAIGWGLRTKINANIGTSTDSSSLKDEIKKLQIAIRYGADTVMDLSTAGNIKKLLVAILENSTVPVGTVPIYEAAKEAKAKRGDFLKFGKEDILEIVYRQAQAGVDFFTIHAGVTLKSLEALKKYPRLLGIVSRGGALLACWMRRYKKENPFYEYFDDILNIAHRYDVTLSLGDGLRPGSVVDATDCAQIEELKILAQLCIRAQEKGIQVIIEGPGHVPLNQIKKNIQLQKRLCRNAPFYVLGPLVTDIGLGYDEISAAIGGAVAAGYGADFLCYVTASEHLRHPTLEDVKRGVIASKIAAHAADIAKGIPGALDWDREISLARKNYDWNRQLSLALDKDGVRKIRQSSQPKDADTCTMCGDYCAIKLSDLA